MRFAVEIVHSIRDAVDPNMPIFFGISVDHRFEGEKIVSAELFIGRNMKISCSVNPEAGFEALYDIYIIKKFHFSY